MRKVLLVAGAIAMGVASAGLLGTGPAGANGGVTLKGRAFVPKNLSVKVGDTVVWTDEDNVEHSVTADDGSFDSGPDCGFGSGRCLKKGDTFEHTFSEAGVYRYHCRIHGGAGGQGMSGTITVG